MELDAKAQAEHGAKHPVGSDSWKMGYFGLAGILEDMREQIAEKDKKIDSLEVELKYTRRHGYNPPTRTLREDT